MAEFKIAVAHTLKNITDEIAGVYYGNFSQMIITHFKKDFSTLEIKS